MSVIIWFVTLFTLITKPVLHLAWSTKSRIFADLAEAWLMGQAKSSVNTIIVDTKNGNLFHQVYSA